MTTIDRTAPAGKWRVIAFNPMTENEWVLDDCETQIAASARMIDEAMEDSSLAFLVYSDVGVCVDKTGNLEC